MNTEPQSKLTHQRPQIWRAAIDLATGLTGYTYGHKAPLADGTITACGGGRTSYRERRDDLIKERERIDKDLERSRDVPRDIMDKMKDEARRKKEEINKEHDDLSKPEYSELDRLYDEKEQAERGWWRAPSQLERNAWTEKQDEIDKRIRKIEKTLKASPTVAVPDGAVEWLLHEVGHWVAASPEERLLPDYGLTLAEHGHDADREWEAWAFEEIVLAPFGPARLIAPPEHRAGVGYSRTAIPPEAFKRVEAQMHVLRIDLAPWRRVCDQWLRWAVPVGQVDRDAVPRMPK